MSPLCSGGFVLLDDFHDGRICFDAPVRGSVIEMLKLIARRRSLRIRRCVAYTTDAEVQLVTDDVHWCKVRGTSVLMMG